MRWVGEIISRVARVYDSGPRLWRILRDGKTPPVSRFCQVYKEIGRILLDRPVWLSSSAPTLREIRAKRRRTEQIGWAERFRRRIHSWHTFQASSAVAGVSLVSIVVMALCGELLREGGISNNGAADGQLLATIAGVLGGGTGMLFAVIVFGLQFQGSRLGELAFLVRFFRRREGLMPIAGFALAVVGANAIVALLCRLGFADATIGMAVLDVVLVPTVLWLALYLLYRMAIVVSEHPLRSYLAALTWEYQLVLDEQVFVGGQIEAYEEALRRAGLEYSTGAGLLEMEATPPTKFRLSNRGEIRDVNVTALCELGAFLREKCAGYEGKVAVGPADMTYELDSFNRVGDHSALIVSATHVGESQLCEEARELEDQAKRTIQRLLDKVFRVGKKEERDLGGVLGDLTQAVVRQGMDGRADQLRESFQVQEHLIKLRLNREDVKEVRYSFYREGLPKYPEEGTFFDLVRGVVASEDREKVSELLGHACELMSLGIQYRDEDLFRCGGQIVGRLYARAMQAEDLAGYVGERIDNWVLGVMDHFAFRRTWRFDRAKVASEVVVVRSALAWVLSLLKLAIEAGRKEDARHFHDRLWRWDEYSSKRHVRGYTEQQVCGEMREVYDLYCAVEIVLAAWCFQHVKKNIGHEGAKELLGSCLSELGTREDVLRVWEVVRNKSYSGGDLATCFGAAHWGAPKQTRTGVSTVWSGAIDAWLLEGFIAVLVARPPALKHEELDFLEGAPVLMREDAEEIRKRAESILGEETVRRDVLGVDDSKTNEILEQLVGLFKQREALWKREQLKCLVESDIVRTRVEELTEKVREKLEEKGYLARMLKNLKGLRNPATASVRPKIVIKQRVRKETFLAGRQGSNGLGDAIAGDLGKRESVHAARVGENAIQPRETVDDLEGLAESVRGARGELLGRGYKQCHVFLPDQARFLVGLTGMWSWEMPSCRRLSWLHLGEWESCDLFRWPHHDCSSVVVMDASRFFGTGEVDFASCLELKVEDVFRSEHIKWLDAAKDETEPSKIKNTTEVQVELTAKMACRVGLCDLNAAVRIRLDLTKLGYAMEHGGDSYHRPNCETLGENAKNKKIEYRLIARLEDEHKDRKPCEKCKADEWDDEIEEKASGGNE